MAKFSDNFWTQDYVSGVNTLFENLKEGCLENQNHINVFVARHQTEMQLGNSLASFPEKFTSSANKNPSLISTTQNTFVGVNNQIGKEGEYHLEIAKNIDQHVIIPFTNWAMKHKERVEYSENTLNSHLKEYEHAVGVADRARVKYFNKVRSAEEFKEKLNHVVTESIKRANSLSKQGVESGIGANSDGGVAAAAASTANLKRSNTTVAEDMKTLSLDPTDGANAAAAAAEASEKSPVEDKLVYLAGDEYTIPQLKSIMEALIQNTPKFSHKVAIFGTYERVSTGAAISESIQKTLGISKLERIESFGQDLISTGYLKLISSVGSQFVNSSKTYYQWKAEAFKVAGIELEEPTSSTRVVSGLSRASTLIMPNERASKISEVFEDVKGMITTMEPTEENYKKILRDVKRLESEYLESTKHVDKVRLELEEAIEEHYNFMQRCELDRLRALKKVTLDFLSILSNKFNSLKAVVDKSLELQSQMEPEQDINKMISTHCTGPFIPHLKVFEDYFDSKDVQVFGVSLQSRCRFDHKSVPIILSSILIHLDESYPNMSGDDERIAVWLNDVSLTKIHELRAILNEPSVEITEQLLSKYNPAVLTNVLRLYLLELPNSLIPNEKYYLMKSLYDQYGKPETEKERIVGIENLLVDLPRPNIATLNYLCSHLSNFISIIALNDNESDEPVKSQEFKTRICHKFAAAVLRPKTQTMSQLNDTHSFSLLYDLLGHKDEVFKELKKRNTVKKSVSRSGSRNIGVTTSAAAASVATSSITVSGASASEASKPKDGPEPDTVIDFN